MKKETKDTLFRAAVILSIVVTVSIVVTDTIHGFKGINIWGALGIDEDIQNTQSALGAFGELTDIFEKNGLSADDEVLNKLADVQDSAEFVESKDDTYLLKINDEQIETKLIGIDIDTSHEQDIDKILKQYDVLFVEYGEDRTDDYGRTYVYLFLPDGTMLQELLLDKGYATVADVSSNTKYIDRFKENE